MNFVFWRVIHEAGDRLRETRGGGTDASNTDPYAEKPTAANHWIKTGPHVMVVGADPSFYDSYPKNADPDTSVPYIMWAGTPYQHLMAPVK